MKIRCKYCLGRERQSFVYVMHMRGDGAVKVGYAANPSKRAAQLRKQFVAPIQLFSKVRTCCEFSAMDVEDRAHRALSDYWTGRGEWFWCTPEFALAAIEKAARR